MTKKKTSPAKSPSKDKKSAPLIHEDMIINDVVGLFPEAAEVMLSFGLHCVGCGASGFETIYEGMVGHGYSKTDMQAMIKELNKFADAYASGKGPGSVRKATKKGTITMTPKAQKKVVAIAEDEGKSDWGLKLEAFKTGCCEVKYALNFEKVPQKTDKVIGVAKGITLLVPTGMWDLVSGAELDFEERADAAGFKVNNPNAKECVCSK